MYLEWNDVDEDTRYMCGECESTFYGSWLDTYYVEHQARPYKYAMCPVCGSVDRFVWDESEDPRELGL